MLTEFNVKTKQIATFKTSNLCLILMIPVEDPDKGRGVGIEGVVVASFDSNYALDRMTKTVN